jgi:hypothetical protein
MKLRQINSNCHELVTKNGSVLFSYETPVAVSFDIASGDKWGVYKTAEKHSVTTTKHINKWTATTRTLPQNDIEYLAHEILRAA